MPGENGLFVFIEQGTDPRLGAGFDAPTGSMCTFDGTILRKNGDSATDWVDAAPGGTFEGGTVPDATTFGGDVTFEEEVTFEEAVDFGNHPISGSPLTIATAALFSGAVEVNGETTLEDDVHITNDAALDVRTLDVGDATHGDFRAIGDVIFATYDGLSGGLLGFFGAGPTDQQAAIPDPAGGGTVDTEARAAIVSLINVVEAFGFIAP